ncbi:MAG: 23S rRNA (adenine(2503)-C(2))-methyltransferase RlmN [Clostridiales bacterium]|nr:23S rRNA (adenine(2503)-C(2))-methyltransferase RlmN [Clostridiales bacterium]
MVKIKSLKYSELEAFVLELGEKKFRAKQIFEWMHKGVRSFDEMKNISKDLKEKLSEKADLEALELETVQVSKKDGTRKYLFRLSDGEFVESVLMRYSYGNTVCISTQAGCRMGCAFCASCEGGLIRNLTSGEILDQVLAVSKDIGEKVDNVVVMGVGEPFDNYENLTGFINNINDKNGFNMGMRSITVSTCGLVPEIKRFAEEYPQVTLAISLHAPNNELRNRLMPVNRKYDLKTLLTACREYVKITNKRITFEYILIEGVNDSDKQAKELADLLKGILCHINLIPFNGVIGKEFVATKREKAEYFKETLRELGFEATVRRELGSDIDGACGQLRSKRR